MKVVFLAEKTCGLTVGGAYFGLVDGFERSAEISPEDGLFCELKPVGAFLPVRFCFDEAFLIAPPPQIRLYYTENGVAVYACDFLRADQSLKILWQKRMGGLLLTLAVQGKVQLYLGGTDAQLVTLPDSFETCEATACGNDILLKCADGFALLSRAGEILVLSEGNVLETGEILKAEVPFHDSLGHTALCQWRQKTLISCAIRTAREPVPATFALALFESALIGADCAPFLGEQLLAKAGSLKEYLGDYRSVVLTQEPEKVGLVYGRSERVFEVRYFRIETENGKVTNIKPCK